MIEEIKQQVAQMYNDGWNPGDIAEELCLSETEVEVIVSFPKIFGV